MGEITLKKQEKLKVKWYGYVLLVLTIVLFSGAFTSAEGPLRALDFVNLCGSFGAMGKGGTEAGVTFASSFRGIGGAGAQDGFLFAMTLISTIIFACGVIQIVDDYDGLKAAQKLLTPIMRPIMGLSGTCALAMVSSIQSVDAGAALTSQLETNGYITPKEKAIFGAFQFSGGAALGNYFASGVALFPFVQEHVAIGVPLLLMLVMKVIGMNIMRLYISRFCKEEK